MKVLLVEDSTPLRGIVKGMLAQLGYTDVVEAADGEEAWHELRQQCFDVLLTDWNMPNLSGLELLKRVRQDAQMADLPVVMLTTRNNREDIISAVRAGINNYVTKPCKPSQLKEKIEKAVHQQTEKLAAAREAGERVVQGCRKYHPARKGPYALFYEVASHVQDLSEGRDTSLAGFYAKVLQVIDRFNQEYPGLDVGHEIEYDTKEITRLVKSDPMVGAVMISARHTEGLSLARMIRFAQEGAVPVCLLCDAIVNLPMDQRDGIVKLGIQLLERDQVTAEELVELLEPALVPPVQKTVKGLKYIEMAAGEGEQPLPGQVVTVHYTGVLPDGRVIVNTTRRSEPVSFTLGQGEVIEGLEQGVGMMRKGGRSLLVVPPELGFGAEGDGDTIPPNTVLGFRVELVEIADPKAAKKEAAGSGPSKEPPAGKETPAGKATPAGDQPKST
jgi:two-component system chemotaxis response regulator CheY